MGDLVFSFHPASRNGSSGVATHDKRLAITDQEYCKIRLRSSDIGGMIGGMCKRNPFRGVGAALSAVEGFTMGYGLGSDALALRVVMDASSSTPLSGVIAHPLPLPAPLEICPRADGAWRPVNCLHLFSTAGLV
jgi:hypothetical protein